MAEPQQGKTSNTPKGIPVKVKASLNFIFTLTAVHFYYLKLKTISYLNKSKYFLAN